MEKIIEYVISAIKALLSILGVEVDAEFEDNLKSMVGGLKDYEPETEADSLDI